MLVPAVFWKSGCFLRVVVEGTGDSVAIGAMLDVSLLDLVGDGGWEGGEVDSKRSK